MATGRFSPDLYLRALRFAAAAHGAQKVPGSDLPYVVHVCAVAAEVIAALGHEPHDDPDLGVACALLHDVVEDTAVPIAAVAAEFGSAIAAGVLALTKNAALPKEQRMRDSLERIRRERREVWMVKLADRITNLQPPPSHWTAEKCRSYRLEAETILEALGSASEHLAARFRDRLAAYRRFESAEPARPLRSS